MQILLILLFINLNSEKLNEPFFTSTISLNDSIPQTQNFSDNDIVFTKVENEAQFPGGDIAWNSYVKKIIVDNIDELTNAGNSGTCRVRFIVSTDGTIKNVEALTMKGTKLAQIAKDAIKTGPKWIPGTQNGRVVNVYREQPITFTLARK